MSLKEELSNNRKLSPHLRMAVMRLDDTADPDQPRFSALIQAAASFNSIAGAQPVNTSGPAGNPVTLNGPVTVATSSLQFTTAGASHVVAIACSTANRHGWV